MRHVLIITHDVVDRHMAGPAIRCWELARVLSRTARVTLATPHPTSLAPAGFALVQYDAVRLQALAAESDVIVLSASTLWLYPFLRDLESPLVVDIYDPFLVESLPLLSVQPRAERERRHSDVLDALTDLLVWGDFFLCASEKQRDYWLGWLNALDRVNPATYDDDPTLRRLIDVVAFGLPEQPPQRTHAVLKSARPGIAADDHVLLWGGGVYNWFDPLTLLQAMARIWAQRQDVKLVFLGIRHPNPTVGGAEMAERAVALSQELGLTDRCVFFNDWTPYEERQNYLLEADLGVSLHFAHLETHFSFRTRLLDCIWAALPILVTRGDVLSETVEQHRLGWTVAPEDVDGVTAAILESLSVPRQAFADRFAAVARELTWERVAQPLVAFCQQPRRAPDRWGAREDLRALPVLKVISHCNALRRDLIARDERLTFLDNVLREREMAIANLERVVLTRETDAAILRNELAALQRHAAQLEQHREQLEQGIARLETALREQGAAKEAEIARLETALREQGAAKDAEIARLQQTLDQIRQGRVMRLLDGVQHIFKGAPLE